MKNNSSSTGSVPVSIQLPAEIAERIQNFRKKLCGIKTNPYICSALHTKGGVNSRKLRVFFMPIFTGFMLPCRALMRRLPFVGVVQRVSVKPFYFTYRLTF